MGFLSSPKSYDLNGKVVLITGGNGGIGSATAEELLRRGARVTIADLPPDTPQRVSRLHTRHALGVVVANAGILPKAATLRTTPQSAIDDLWRSTSRAWSTPSMLAWNESWPARNRSC